MEKNIGISNRIPYIDLGAGIMILYMLIYHAMLTDYRMELAWLKNTDLANIAQCPHVVTYPSGKLKIILPFITFPYLHFLMAWFFYKSGQFFKKRSVLDMLKKDASKLLTPYLIWSAIGFCVYVLFCILKHNISFHTLISAPIKQFVLQGTIPLNGSLWFLFSLLLVRAVANVLFPDKNGKIHIQSAAIVICSYLVAYAAWRWNSPRLPLWVGNSAMGLAFFTLGYWLAEYENKWWLLVPCVLIYCMSCVWGHSIVVMKTNQLIAGQYWLNIPTSFAAIVAFNALCRYCIKYLPHVSLPIERIGMWALPVFLVQGILYRSVGTLLTFYSLTSLMPYAFWITIGAYLLFIPSICYIYYRGQIRRASVYGK